MKNNRNDLFNGNIRVRYRNMVIFLAYFWVAREAGLRTYNWRSRLILLKSGRGRQNFNVCYFCRCHFGRRKLCSVDDIIHKNISET